MDKKYSTGTKGRLEKHADECKTLIRERCDDFHLASEYIESIDPERENKVWQQYQRPEDCLPALEVWLSGGEDAPGSSGPPDRFPGDRVETPRATKLDLEKTGMDAPGHQSGVIPASLLEEKQLDPQIVLAIQRVQDWSRANMAALVKMDCSLVVERILERVRQEIGRSKK